MKKTVEMKLKEIFEKFNGVEYSEPENYDLTDWDNNNYRDVRNDEGKLTLGNAVKIFKKATKASSKDIREIIETNYRLEWHYAGYISSAKKMNKVYFMNAKQIVDLAKNWDKYYSEYLEFKENFEKMKEFLSKHGTWIERTVEELKYFFVLRKEMNSDKYGWFKAKPGYKTPIYRSGWKLSEEDYKLFEEKFRETIKELNKRELQKIINLRN